MSLVSDAGPLIALAELGQLDLLHALGGDILIPPAVHAAVFLASSRACPPWITVRSPSVSSATSLDQGEDEAIQLAAELSLLILMDEKRGRRLAMTRGLRVTGTLGLLLEAKNRALVPAVAPLLRGLKDTGFHISRPLEAEVLRRAGESGP